MTTPMNGGRRWRVCVLALATLAVSSGAIAQGRVYDRRFLPDHQHFDTRFAHNHPYFDRGYVIREPPRIGYPINYGRYNYWYDRGQWYRRNSVNWIVVGAPIGAYVSILPPFYSTVWYSGVPYYYANDTYYTWRSTRNEYEVVEPPDGIESSGTTQAPASDEIFIYPKLGQSSDQQARDRYECHRYAVEQTGYDLTQAGGGVPATAASGKRSDYYRADTACLDGRGYSVR